MRKKVILLDDGSRLPAPTEEQKTRITADLKQKLNAVVDQIAAERGATREEVLQFAINFLRNPQKR